MKKHNITRVCKFCEEQVAFWAIREVKNETLNACTTCIEQGKVPLNWLPTYLRDSVKSEIKLIIINS